jgi:hypothetical protein
MASEARPSNGADSRDPLDRHASLAMTEIELFTRKRYYPTVRLGFSRAAIVWKSDPAIAIFVAADVTTMGEASKGRYRAIAIDRPHFGSSQ